MALINLTLVFAIDERELYYENMRQMIKETMEERERIYVNIKMPEILI